MNSRSWHFARSYGSCNDQNQSQSRPTKRLGEKKRNNVHVFLVAVSEALLLAAVLLFVAHEQRTPVPLGNTQVTDATASKSTMMMTAANKIIPDPNAYPRRPFITNNGCNITLPVLGFPSSALAQYPHPEDQSIANEAVRHAIEDLKISYFDIAPEYGEGITQERLGIALTPYDRKHVFLAAKTMYRDAVGSVIDLDNTLKSLKTDHLDLYQFHSISTESDIQQILGEGGAMETFQKAKMEGKIRAIGFSAHSEPMAVRMIESGTVDMCMFPINFAAYHYGGVGQEVLNAAIKNNVGVIALKSGARRMLTPDNGEAAHVPDTSKHILEWKRKEMIDYPVVTSKVHHTWYEQEILWALNQPGVTAVMPPGSLRLFDGISDMLRGKIQVPKFEDEHMQHMLQKYTDIVSIFHNKSESGDKVST